MKIAEIKAFPVSVKVEKGARLAIGRAVKRDTVIVKVTTEDGIVGWGESHHARSAGVIAEIVNSTLKELVLPASADDVVGIWAKIYDWQLKSHGMGAATAMAMSGLDMALWDIRGKAVGWPLYKLLGGGPRPIKAYAGGVALGWQEPQALADEVAPHVEVGFKAVKLRVGDTPSRDIARVRRVRERFPELTILVDANTGYSLDDVRHVMPAYEELRVDWLEEPFAPHDHHSYMYAARLGRVPLACGENHYTRFEFARVIEDGAVTVVQPDVSKAGGPTEMLRIAAMASARKLKINPHSSITSLNHATTVHLLMATENAGYFEADGTDENPLRTVMTSPECKIGQDGTVMMSDKPGIGVDVDEKFIMAHPFIPGRNFV
jgi:L-alanine-DL-glutamate epimerase-like enolase superfamily enzyme